MTLALTLALSYWRRAYHRGLIAQQLELEWELKEAEAEAAEEQTEERSTEACRSQLQLPRSAAGNGVCRVRAVAILDHSNSNWTFLLANA